MEKSKTVGNATGETNEKVLLLAVGLREGNIVITPFDHEHDHDDQSALSEQEQQLFKKCQADFAQHQAAFETGLKALYTMFAWSLPRERFACFENYCFALHDMALPNDKLEKLKAKVNRLKLKPGRPEVKI